VFQRSNRVTQFQQHKHFVSSVSSREHFCR
jgi:hypothetical protein